MARNKYPEETVEKILSVSLRLFLEKGYEHTTLQDIIDQLGGLTKGAIYHHFKGKEDILLAVANRMGEASEQQMGAIRDDPSMNGLEKLRAIFRMALSSPEQTQMFSVAPNLLNNPQLLTIILKDITETVVPGYVGPILEEAVRDGSVQTDYPEELAEALLLLSNLWLNPLIYPSTLEKARRRIECYDQILQSMGLPLLNRELRDTWENYCMLSQERV